MIDQDPFISKLQAWNEIFMRQSMQNLIHFSRESGLSVQQIRALFRIHYRSRGVSDLGEHLGITKAAASQMLNRLVEQGMIVRIEDPLDRRGKQITLTEKGFQAMQKSMDARQGWLNQLAAVFSPAEKEQVGQLLAILMEKIQRIELGSNH